MDGWLTAIAVPWSALADFKKSFGYKVALDDLYGTLN